MAFDLFNVVSWKTLLVLILSAYVIKLVVTPIAAVPATLIAVMLKKVEGVDVYDYAVDYSPFKLN